MNREDVAEVLAKPISQELLGSSIPAWLAYAGVDGEPRVIPIGFWWTGEHVGYGHRAEVGEGSGTATEPQGGAHRMCGGSAEEATMPRYMLLTKYDVDSIGAGPMSEWDPDDITAHLEFLRALNQELIDNGELVDMQALTGPELAKIVTFDGQGSPVVTDGPYTEVKEVLAGYQLVDVESEARAIEIAARVSAAPGPGGVPLRNRIEVRQLMGAVLEPGDL